MNIGTKIKRGVHGVVIGTKKIVAFACGYVYDAGSMKRTICILLIIASPASCLAWAGYDYSNVPYGASTADNDSQVAQYDPAMTPLDDDYYYASDSSDSAPASNAGSMLDPD